MAIVFEKERHQANWLGIIFAIVVLGGLGGAVYYLFFAPTPKIAAILPKPLTPVNDLSKIISVDFNPQKVVDDPIFKNYLKEGAKRPGSGPLGRVNPFLPY